MKTKLSLDKQCRALGLPTPIAEYQFAKHLSPSQLKAIGQVKPRLWRVDWIFLEPKLAIEVEGGYAHGGRHTSVKGFLQDCEKYNALNCLGFRLLRVTPRWVEEGIAVEWIRRALTPVPLDSAPMLPIERTA